jgi:DNA-binding response OmpR family regulator
MTRPADDPVGRRFGLVLSGDEDRRERGCKALVSDGFDVLAFLDAGSVQAWLEEDTPEIAIIDDGAGRGSEIVADILERRGVRIMPLA